MVVLSFQVFLEEFPPAALSRPALQEEIPAC
jgi:hypothetical protein